ncbi:MAG TPA: hypothetical protein DHV62_00380 [Elusimicrobia bacterium]|jgi:DNA-binding MarR family transcriptional regulator|nr:hypothetical protein [Elusimicrobiota bacterium]
MNEREFAIIKEITNNHCPNQRLIARKLGISLGLTNLIIKRLIRKGYLKVSQLNSHKVQYILTPQGFAEKTKKSYYYTLDTIAVLRTLKQKIQKIVLSEYNKGVHKFVIQGDSELAELVEISLRDLNLENLEYLKAGNDSLPIQDNFCVLNSEGNLAEESNPSQVYPVRKSIPKDKPFSNEINLLQRLAETLD